MNSWIFICHLSTFLLVASSPNIIVILVDDVGWADVSYQAPVSNPVFTTPNIDFLANSGVRLTRFYTHPTCTPSRAALLSSRYATNVGLTTALLGGSPWGMPSKYKLLPSALKEVNYTTHLVGKWHLGYAKPEYTPTRHGFDTFFGMFNGAMDYWMKTVPRHVIDLHRNDGPFLDETHTHATQLFTEEAQRVIRGRRIERGHGDARPFFLYLAYTAAHTPLQAGPRHSEKCSHIAHPVRRGYCGLMIGLDEAIGNLTTTLRQEGLLDDTIVVFASDNGGQPQQGSNNWPFRGSKFSGLAHNAGWFITCVCEAFEGGSRVAAFVYSPKYFGNGVYDGLMHIVDVAPTLLSIARNESRVPTSDKRGTLDSAEGGTALPPVDGVDQWHALRTRNGQSPREFALVSRETFVNMNAVIGYGGKWKLIFDFAGDSTLYPVRDAQDRWLLPVENSTFVDKAADVAISLVQMLRPQAPLFMEVFIHERHYWNDRIFGTNNSVPINGRAGCLPSVQLFNLFDDPQETRNVAAVYPEIVNELRSKFDAIAAAAPRQFDWDQMDRQYHTVTPFSSRPELEFAEPWLSDDTDPTTWPSGRVRSFGALVRIYAVYMPLALLFILCLLGVWFVVKLIRVLRKSSGERKLKAA